MLKERPRYGILMKLISLITDDLLRDVANYHLDCLVCCSQVDHQNVLGYFPEGSQKDLVGKNDFNLLNWL